MTQREHLVDTKILASTLYERVLQTANYFLHNCRSFPLDMLKTEDPSFKDLAGGVFDASENHHHAS